jgi:hypothetical protein
MRAYVSSFKIKRCEFFQPTSGSPTCPDLTCQWGTASCGYFEVR